MTISRKEYAQYEEALDNITFLAYELCRAWWWQFGVKRQLRQDIADECTLLTHKLAGRVSKPRKKIDTLREPVEQHDT